MKEELINKLEEYASQRANKVYDVDFDELIDLVKDGAEWMFNQLNKEGKGE